MNGGDDNGAENGKAIAAGGARVNSVGGARVGAGFGADDVAADVGACCIESYGV